MEYEYIATSRIDIAVIIYNDHCCNFLFQALCGTRVDVPTLNGERLVVNLLDEIVKPTTVKRIAGKGLPLSKDPTRKGDMLISFEIVFPEKLNGNTKDLLRNSLPSK